MATDVVALPEVDIYRPVASPWHTLFVLVVQGLLVFRGITHASQMRDMANPDRVALYQRTIFFEWLMLAVVLAGVWLRGSSLYTVLGERWRSLRQVLRDLGIGVLFLMAAIAVDSIVGAHLQGGAADHATQFILPHGRLEMMWWVALSLSAAICEEAIYRGYLQRQFTALTRNVPVGIVLSAAIFGVAHGYQGLRHAFQIGLLGVMGGMLAHWRKSVRPGMIAHALQDVLGGIIKH